MPKNTTAGSSEPPPGLLVPRTIAASRIEGRIQKGRKLASEVARTWDELAAISNEFEKWSAYNAEMLRHIFNVARFAQEYSREFGGVYVFGQAQPSLEERQKDMHQDIARKINTLESIKERLELIPELTNEAPTQAAPAVHSESAKKAFVVHGHDDGARESVARFLEKLRVTAVILHEQANEGRTIIEKLEHHSNVDFAIVLLTPDDLGTPANAASDLKPRARQNVILELGYFVGKLGRDRVCALHKGNVELPSDIVGIIYIPIDSGNGWQVLLAKELRAAGFAVDLNAAI